MPRKVVASTYITIDGFIDEPGKWSFPFWCEEAAQFKSRELFAADALLLGRITYEGFAAAWPTMEGTGEFGERMNSMPKYVASRTLEAATWNATIMRGDVAEAVRKLKQDGDPPDRARGRREATLPWRPAAHSDPGRQPDVPNRRCSADLPPGALDRVEVQDLNWPVHHPEPMRQRPAPARHDE